MAREVGAKGEDEEVVETVNTDSKTLARMMTLTKEAGHKDVGKDVDEECLQR